LSHFFGLILKRYNYFKRDSRGLACEILLPILIVVFGLLLLLIEIVVESPSELLSPKLNPGFNPMPTIFSGNYESADKSNISNISEQFS